MKTAILIATGAIAMTLASTALARLGESRAEIEKRLGVPVEEKERPLRPSGDIKRGYPDYSLRFESGGFKVTVYFWNGKSIKEVYETADKQPLTQEEVNTLLEAHGGKNWKPSTNAGCWISADWKDNSDGVKDVTVRGNLFTVSSRKEWMECQRTKQEVPNQMLVPKDAKKF